MTKPWAQKVDSFDHLRILNRFSRIRIIDPNAVVVQQNGELARMVDMEDELPLMILNPHECTREGIDKLLDSDIYRWIFSNPQLLENDVAYDAETKDLDRRSIKRHRMLKFQQMYPHCNEFEWNNYKSCRTMEERELYLDAIYDTCVDALDRDQLAKDAAAISAKIRPNGQMARDVRLEAAIAALPDDFLEIMNYYGANIVAVKHMHHVDRNRDAEALCRDAVGQIYITASSLESYRMLPEEVIHYVDKLLGFTARKEWARACELDFKDEESAEFAGWLDYFTDKGEINDHYNYSDSDRPAELLPDFYIAEKHFDDVIKSVKKWEKDPEAPEAIRKIAQVFRDCEYDLGSIMQYYFPRTWKLYEGYDSPSKGHVDGFMEKVGKQAAEFRNTYFEQALKDEKKRKWTDSVATGDDKSQDIGPP